MSSRLWRRCCARHVIASALLVAGEASPAGAQRTTYHNFNSWYNLAADVGLDQRWTGSVDMQDKRSGPIRQPEGFLFRLSLTDAVAPAVKLGFGVVRSESYPFGEIPSAYQTPERSVFEQVQLTQNIDRLTITHRYRLEERWLGKRGADTSDHRIANWLQSGRARYQLKGVLPMHGQRVEVGAAYLAATDEVFVNFGKNVANNVFDQNRAGVALGWRYAHDWRGEVGFLQQTSLKPNGRDLEQNATLTFGMYYTRQARKKD